MINLHESKVWDLAEIELATPDLQSDSHLLPDTLPTAERFYFELLIVQDINIYTPSLPPPPIKKEDYYQLFSLSNISFGRYKGRDVFYAP